MAQITITVPNGLATRFVNSIGYKATIQDENGNDIPNPQTAVEYAKAWIIQVCKDQILRTEAEVAGQTARQAKLNEEVDIT